MFMDNKQPDELTEHLCACGCGQPVKPDKKYIRGHWSRTKSARAMYEARRSVEHINPTGLCFCGCGQTTPIAKENHAERGYYKGQHIRFCPGHQEHLYRGEKAAAWKGGRHVSNGYAYVYTPDHPQADRDGYVEEHRLVVEQALCRYLDPQERVHHINGDKLDNRPENLVVLQTQSEHKKLHGIPELEAYHAAHPETRYEAGEKGRETQRRKRQESRKQNREQ